MGSQNTDRNADGRAKAAAQWWTDALSMKRALDDTGIMARVPESLLPYPISHHQVENFQDALERQIEEMLQDGLPHVLCASSGHASHLLCRAAENCGIPDICYRLPDQVIMRIFPNTVIVNIGPFGSFEVVWSTDTVTYGEQCTGSGTQQDKLAA
jgi:hypothetical protein